MSEQPIVSLSLTKSQCIGQMKVQVHGRHHLSHPSCCLTIITIVLLCISMTAYLTFVPYHHQTFCIDKFCFIFCFTLTTYRLDGFHMIVIMTRNPWGNMLSWLCLLFFSCLHFLFPDLKKKKAKAERILCARTVLFLLSVWANLYSLTCVYYYPPICF